MFFTCRLLCLSSSLAKLPPDMAVQAQLGGFATGCLPLPCSFAEEQMQMRAPLMDYDAFLSAAANNAYHCPGVVVSGTQSELTCNASGGVVVPSSRKRGREEAGCFEFEQFVSSPSSSAALLPIPMMQKASRVADSPATASTSGQEDALVVSELWAQQHGAEVDAVVRAECERMRAGLEHARRRRRQALAQALAGAAARRLREAEAELATARRRAAELEARLQQAAAESQAWCGVARGHEALAAELRAALDHHLLLLLRGAGEGSGESSSPGACADDAESCCLVASKDDAAGGRKWACRACGEGEATVLLLPCRHLCLCKSCEPRTDACPVCLAAKNASIHVAPN